MCTESEWVKKWVFGGSCTSTTSSRSMKLLSWNCQGLGHPLTVRAAHSLARGSGINLLFLMETKCTVYSLRSLAFKLGFCHFYGLDACGSRGGLWAAWDNSVNVQVVETNLHFLLLKLEDGIYGDWFLLLIYGHPVLSRREDTWAFLGDLASKLSGLFLAMGDFNQVLNDD